MSPGKTAEERPVTGVSRTARERPLQRRPMMVGHRERLYHKDESRWYRGECLRPHMDEGVLF